MILQVMILLERIGCWCTDGTCCVVLGTSSSTLAMGPRDHRADILDAADTCSGLRYDLPELYLLGKLDAFDR